MSLVRLPMPDEFSFDLALTFLKRSPRELLHTLEGDKVFKALHIDNTEVLISIHQDEEDLLVNFLNTKPNAALKAAVLHYIREWFDMDTNLKPFYMMAKKDELLAPLVKSFHGYRIVGQPDLFESLVWAVLGQQINLAFAYTLKQRFVEQFGESQEYKNQKYYVFPKPEVVARLTDDDLLPLQFSRQKSKYVVLIAQAFMNGEVSKEKLRGLSLLDAKEKLMKIKGVGNWTANYALMKTFRYPDAFPLEDVGVHNAIKNQLALKSKPSLDRVKKIFKRYKGWEAYATLYLWKSL
jgi:DNA-3-methyladenine glycosylase II